MGRPGKRWDEKKRRKIRGEKTRRKLSTVERSVRQGAEYGQREREKKNTDRKLQ